jgi:cullin 1
MKAEIKAEGARVLRAVDEERNYAIQATIVRIMKARTVSPGFARVRRLAEVLPSRLSRIKL